MRKLTLALLLGAYVCLAVAAGGVGLRLEGEGAGLAAGIGALALCLAAHSLVLGLAAETRLARGLDALRTSHLALHGEIETTRVLAGEGVRETIAGAMSRSEQTHAELRELEDVVQKLGERMQSELGAKAADSPRPQMSPETALGRTVRAALAAGRVDLYLQAVVSLPQRRTQFYESFSRLRDETGRVLMPAEFLSIAEPGGLVAAIDNLLLFRCVQIVRRLAGQERRIGIFCNISAASLSDAEFFSRFLEFLTANKDLAGALIFEIGQQAFEARGSTEVRNMARLADLGFRFSIDKVSRLALDFQDLARSDVGFVKIGAPLLLSEIGDAEGRVSFKSAPDIEAVDYSALARRHGIQLIAEKVETERQVVDVLELDIGYGQGHLFGEPRPIREQILTASQPPGEVLQAALRRAPG